MQSKIPRVLAIHDLCVFGRCSLSVVSPLLSAGGVQCCALPTALLSTPTNYEGNTQASLTSEFMGIFRHLKDLNVHFDAIYSGFLMDYKQAELITKAYEYFPNALRVCDPVLGDGGRLYRTMDEKMVAAIKELSSKAEIITPNITEAAVLLGKSPDCTPRDENEIADWALRLSESYCKTLAITGITLEKEPNKLLVALSEQGEVSTFSHELIDGNFPGTGDMFVAFMLAKLLTGMPFTEAAKSAAEFIWRCAEYTIRQGTDNKEGLLFEAALRNFEDFVNPAPRD